ncbi:MAG: hypothetical protein JWO81_2314 [Alphaproteobacteria bacterium]|nr:hypothetical protein [Alphaproteobacteria bacterium]
MDHRHLIAYLVLLLLVLALAGAAFVLSSRWRHDRRQSLRFGREQARRREEARSEES